MSDLTIHLKSNRRHYSLQLFSAAVWFSSWWLNWPLSIKTESPFIWIASLGCTLSVLTLNWNQSMTDPCVKPQRNVSKTLPLQKFVTMFILKYQFLKTTVVHQVHSRKWWKAAEQSRKSAKLSIYSICPSTLTSVIDAALVQEDKNWEALNGRNQFPHHFAHSIVHEAKLQSWEHKEVWGFDWLWTLLMQLYWAIQAFSYLKKQNKQTKKPSWWCLSGG